MGRLPALVVIDKAGTVRHTHHGASMRDIPDNETVLQILEQLEQKLS
jgi:peroxiredoxin